jgi:lipopolysaccharide biosynthesis regulator YciM
MENANEENKTAKFDIANLLGWFECELAKETNAGSPVDARRELIRALAVYSGISKKQIQDSLGELSNDNIDEVFEELRNAPQPDWDAVTRDFRKHAAKSENE